MSRRRSVMSESFKNELAKDLGFYEVVQREGWEGIRTKDAGNMVKRAIQIAQETLVKQQTASAPPAQASYRQPYAQAPAPQPYAQAPAPAQQPYAQTSYNQGGYGGYSPNAMTNQAPTGFHGAGTAPQQGSPADQRPSYS
ncbi:small acid-soluble spore protein F (minor alpha/beta-type SASP) [Bacillus sp. 3255]|nr:small acid-soluble spore protein F (minor alpha/beta-type SASP) [Bacillus sp. 3255]